VRILGRAKVRTVEHFLKTKDLNAAPSRLFNEGNMNVNGRLSHGVDGRGRVGERRRRLDQTAENFAWHPRNVRE
jgi:hypothetical protein